VRTALPEVTVLDFNILEFVFFMFDPRNIA